MLKHFKTFLLILLPFTFAVNAHAQNTNFKSFSIDYSNTLDGTATGYGKWYFAKDKRRVEQAFYGNQYMQGRKNVAIIRLDKQVMWELDSDLKIYTERSLHPKGSSAMAQDIKNHGIEKPMGTLVGSEKIDGKIADKYVWSVSTQNPFKTTTQMTSYYVHDSMIPIRIKTDIQSNIMGNIKNGVGIMEFKNVQFNEPSAQLFEIPAGYKFIPNSKDFYKLSIRKVAQ